MVEAALRTVSVERTLRMPQQVNHGRRRHTLHSLRGALNPINICDFIKSQVDSAHTIVVGRTINNRSRTASLRPYTVV